MWQKVTKYANIMSMEEGTDVRFELVQSDFWNTYKVPILLGIVSVLLIVLSIVLLIKSTQTAPIRFSGESASTSAILNGTITIDIEGAVVRPGVYEMTQGSRIEDAITKSGGLSADADTERIAKTINRAAKLTDGMKLFFPFIEGTSVPSESLQEGESVVGVNGVSINSATRDELISLYGVGPATADKIITGRPYSSVEELLSRHILNSSTYTKLKDQLTL
jgi:competence protein ComEA